MGNSTNVSWCKGGGKKRGPRGRAGGKGEEKTSREELKRGGKRKRKGIPQKVKKKFTALMAKKQGKKREGKREKKALGRGQRRLIALFWVKPPRQDLEKGESRGGERPEALNR